MSEDEHEHIIPYFFQRAVDTERITLTQPREGAMTTPLYARPQTFRDELTALINKYSLESGSDTPDFLLASYLEQCLILFGQAVQSREQWYGRGRRPASADIVAQINAREAESLEALRREAEENTP